MFNTHQTYQLKILVILSLFFSPCVSFPFFYKTISLQTACAKLLQTKYFFFLFYRGLVGLDREQKYNNKILCFGWIFSFWEK